MEYRLSEGTGKPVVFIHGWLGSKEFWDLIMPHLQVENPVLTYDQKCSGDSTAENFTVEDLADDLWSLLDELEIDEPVLVGHSMGGMTALRYTVKYSNYSGLLLMASSASTPEPEKRSVSYFLKKFNEIPREEWAEEITDNYVGSSADRRIRKMTEKELFEANEEPVVAGLEAMVEYDVTDQLETVEKPSLVVKAGNDGAITEEKSRELADLLGCQTVSLETSHQILPEKPVKTAGIIEDFIKSVK